MYINIYIYTYLYTYRVLKSIRAKRANCLSIGACEITEYKIISRDIHVRTGELSSAILHDEHDDHVR